MSSVEAYQKNLHQRLNELRHIDKAYDLHEAALAEAIIFTADHFGDPDNTIRILDVGCGLGFMTARLARSIPDTKIVGIDPSEEAIRIARSEHPDISFYTSTAQAFLEIVLSSQETPFDQALLNMVLHSVNDDEARSILAGVKNCLQPDGAILLIVPTEKWMRQKLIEYAQDQNMNREDGIRWVAEQLTQKEIRLPVRTRNGEYYSEPITMYYRSLEEYADLLTVNGYGIPLQQLAEDGTVMATKIIPYWQPKDYFKNNELSERNRILMISLIDL